MKKFFTTTTELLDVELPAGMPAAPMELELERVKQAEAMVKAMVKAEVEAQAAGFEARAQAVVDSAEATAGKLIAMVGNMKPKVVGIKINEAAPVILKSRPHAMLPMALREIRAGMVNLGMTGPRGSGKTTLGQQIAEALDVPFGFISVTRGISESQLYGRWTPKNEFCEAPLWEMMDKPGVFLLDEIDCGDPNTLLACNSIMANGIAVNPYTGEVKERHEEFIILGAMNTTGRGATAEYNSRERLDAATLDRLALMRVDYDRELEAEILSDEVVLGKLWDARERLQASKSKEVIGTRAIVRTSKYLSAGYTVAEIFERLLEGWDAQSRTIAALAA